MAGALTFPRWQHMPKAASEPIVARICRDVNAAAPKRILFLDDNDTLRQLLVDTIAPKYCVEFLQASSVGEARGVIKNYRIDAALLDIKLTDGSGIEFYRELQETHPEVETCFLTAYDDLENRRLIEEAGPARVFDKRRMADANFVARLLTLFRVAPKTVSATPFAVK